MCETKTKVHDISQELYKNLCEMRTAANLLQDLAYPSLRQTCLDCLGRIDSDASSKTCKSCQRSCHSQCLQLLATLHYQIKKKLATGTFECLSCIQYGKCIECKNNLDPEDKRTYACRICLRKVHQRCHHIPLQVMEYGNQRKFANLKQCSNVCPNCLSRYGIKNVVDTYKFNLKNYLLVQVKHPSPIHLTWIEDSQLSSKSQNNQNVLVNAEPQIQTIISMHVPQHYSNATVDGVYVTLNQQGFLCSNFPMKKTFKFLTKWRHNHSTLVWQQMRVFQNEKIHISKFIHQLKMNDIASHLELPPIVLEKYFANCINEYAIAHNINIGKRNDSNLQENLAFENEQQIVQMDHIYQIYCKKYKQYLNIKKADVKAQTMCELIKMIYFVDGNPFPVVIFADETKISWWMGNIMQRVPYLSVLALHGLQQYIENLLQTHLFKPKQEGLVLRFNILVVSYQSLKIISNLFDFKQILQSFSLMIFDEKMNGLGKHYYDHVKIGRIKFHKDNREDTATKSTDRNDLTESQHNSQKKSSLTLSSSRNLKLLAQKSNNIDHQKQPRPIANIITDQFYEGFYHNNHSFTGKLLNRFARVVFLRYVLYFGLNANSKQEIYDKMIEIEPGCFQEPKEEALPKLEKHLHYFIAHVTKYKGYINADIKNYLFFNSKSKQIIKIIADLARLKDFCSIFQANPLFQLKIQRPSLAMQDVVILKRWQTRFDYYICKLVLAHGVGRWQKMSQSIQDWNKDGKPVSLRVFLCQQSGINLMGAKYFSEFLRVRTKQIAFALERGRTQ